MDNKCKNTQKDPLTSKNVIIIIIIIVVSLIKITHCSIFELHTAHSFGYRRLRYDRRATLTSKAVLRSFGSPGGGEEEEEQKKAYKKMLARKGKSAPAKRPASASKPRPPAAKKPKTEPDSAKPKKAVAVDDDDSDDDAPLASLKRSGEGGGFTIPKTDAK